MDFRTSSGLSNTSCEFTVAEPVLGEMKHVKMRIVVDLPAPFGPRKPTISPRFTSKLILSSARNDPKLFDKSFALIITSLDIPSAPAGLQGRKRNLYTQRARSGFSATAKTARGPQLLQSGRSRAPTRNHVSPGGERGASYRQTSSCQPPGTAAKNSWRARLFPVRATTGMARCVKGPPGAGAGRDGGVYSARNVATTP